MTTQMYLGDGLYAKFDGYHIVLSANGDGVHTLASDTVALEPGVYGSFVEWVNAGYPDYNTGKTFKETMDAPPTSSG